MALLCLYLTNLQGEVYISFYLVKYDNPEAIKEMNFQVLQKEDKFTKNPRNQNVLK